MSESESAHRAGDEYTMMTGVFSQSAIFSVFSFLVTRFLVSAIWQGAIHLWWMDIFVPVYVLAFHSTCPRKLKGNGMMKGVVCVIEDHGEMISYTHQHPWLWEILCAIHAMHSLHPLGMLMKMVIWVSFRVEKWTRHLFFLPPPPAIVFFSHFSTSFHLSSSFVVSSCLERREREGKSGSIFAVNNIHQNPSGISTIFRLLSFTLGRFVWSFSLFLRNMPTPTLISHHWDA